jgi:hypothetical protein
VNEPPLLRKEDMKGSVPQDHYIHGKSGKPKDLHS